MKLSLIVAMTKNRVIGNAGKMPWHISDELKYFKKITMGKPIIMGRKTFASLNYKTLPGRTNVVITSNVDKLKQLAGNDVIIVDSISNAINSVKNYSEVFFIGGANIYSAVLDKVDNIYLSLIKQDYIGDLKFPEFNFSKMQEISRQDFPEFQAIIYQK